MAVQPNKEYKVTCELKGPGGEEIDILVQDVDSDSERNQLKEAFVVFVKSEFSSENLEFLQAVDALFKKPNATLDDWEKCYQHFMVISKDSLRAELNIDSNEKN